MKIIKLAVVFALIYVGLVAAFESLIGFFQPSNSDTLTISTTDDSGAFHDRVLSRLESDGKLYVAVNHWPRAWYKQLQARPDVRVALEAGGAADYTAVQVSGAEHVRVESEHSASLLFRIMTGFPPRYFIRLDPKL